MTQSIKIKKNIFWSIIPAKENSVRIKNKNIQKINGLMLFEYSVISSLKIKSIEKTFISSLYVLGIHYECPKSITSS